MYHLSSTEMREREKQMTDYVNGLIEPARGYGAIYRRADDRVTGFIATIGLPKLGYPDLVISGTIDAIVRQHRDFIDSIASEMFNGPTLGVIDPDDFVDLIDGFLEARGYKETVKAVLINTDQFVNGYGLNSGRYYKANGITDATIIQLVACIKPNVYQEKSTASQTLYETQPFGKKEQPDASVLLDA